MTDTGVVVYLRQAMEEWETGILERWLEEVYDGACTVVYLTE